MRWLAMTRTGAGTVTLAGALAAAGCSRPAELGADRVWVRLPAVPGRPAAAYFTLHGGPTAKTLINVTTDVAIRSEMHASMTGANGMAAMKPLASVAVPAAREVVFAPGGRHVMLFNVNPGIKAGERRILLTFTFADGTRFRHTAEVLGPADAPS